MKHTWLKSLLKSSIHWAIMEIQIKTTLRFHLMLVRMANINNIYDGRCWQGWREKGTLIHCQWECKLVKPLWKINVDVPQKAENRSTTRSSYSTRGHIAKELNTIVHKGLLKRYMWTHYYKSFLNYIHKWKKFKWSHHIMGETSAPNRQFIPLSVSRGCLFVPGCSDPK